MDQIIRIGLDTSKQNFQLHGVNAAEEPVLRRKLRRTQMVAFFAAQPRTVIGITPKDHSTGGKTRLGTITRAGDEGLRSVLVVGATALIRQVRRSRGRPWPWLQHLLSRKPPKLVAVALANKIARIAWKLMASGQSYDAAHGTRTA